jgi:hypothetical protein
MSEPEASDETKKSEFTEFSRTILLKSGEPAPADPDQVQGKPQRSIWQGRTGKMKNGGFRCRTPLP